MSGLNNASSSNSNSTGSFSLVNICARVTLDGSIFNYWIRNIRMALFYEENEYILEKQLLTPVKIGQKQSHVIMPIM